MFKGTLIAATATATIFAASAVNAASITVETFSAAAFTAFNSTNLNVVTEDFEGFAVGEGDFTSTSVGSFTAVPVAGSGGSVIGSGAQLAVSDQLGFGRENTSVGGSQWLDSNDNAGISWNANLGGGLFNRLAFSLSDAADVGATLTVSADGNALTQFVGQTNNTVDWIVISFASEVASADISLLNNIGNDGFGIDDVSVAAVPLPAGAALMLTGLGGLAIARRRKAAK